jgi:hypothetical protein
LLVQGWLVFFCLLPPPPPPATRVGWLLLALGLCMAAGG